MLNIIYLIKNLFSVHNLTPLTIQAFNIKIYKCHEQIPEYHRLYIRIDQMVL